VRQLLLLLRRRLGVARVGSPREVDGGVERSHARRLARDVRIRSPIEEVLREIEPTVHGGDEERARLASLAHLVHVGSVVEERRDGLHVSLTRREEESRHPALDADEVPEGWPLAPIVRFVLRVLFGRHPAEELSEDVSSTFGFRLRVLLGRRLRFSRGRRFLRALLSQTLDPLLEGLVGRLGQGGSVDQGRRERRVGAAREEQGDDIRSIGRRGEHQGGLASLRLLRVDRGSAREKEPHRFLASGGGREHQGRRSRASGQVGVGSRVQKRFHHRGMPAPAREDERSVGAEPGRGFDVGPGVEKHPGDLDVVRERGPVKRRHAIALGGVHVGALFQE